MELVTGHTGSTHITAEQVSRLLKGATATDSTTVQRLNVGNLAALSYADATMEIATGEMLLNGFHVTFEESESIPLDATVESTNSRIDKIVLEIIQDNTTSYQTAELVIVQGEEAESPTAPDTPTEPDSGTEEFLAVGVIAQVTITADAITEFTDLTNLYGGNYVELTDYETDKTSLQNADTVIKKEVPWYATSDTAESTTAKVATCNQTGFALETGAKVIVKFDYTNTASSPTLNVNSTGDIAIVAYGTTAPTLFWLAGDVVEFTYDGTSWVMHPTQGQVDTLNSNLSHVGMIIHSTTLSTLSQVQAIYGTNTTWIQHSGYMLRGATSGVVANSATKTGGNDGAWLMQHSHSVTYNNTGNGTLAAYGTGNGSWGSGNNLRGDTTITINNAGSVASTNTTANIPNYKSVYIWERTA